MNIEDRKHLDLVIPFCQKHQPDVVCFQEVCRADMASLEQELKMSGQFVPMVNVTAPNRFTIPMGEWGVAMFSTSPLSNVRAQYYKGTADNIPELGDGEPNSVNRVLLSATVQHGETTYAIATTHFTWSPEGKPTDEQRRDLRALLSSLATLDEFILCGDFNAPRGGEIFAELAARAHDNIPPEVRTSLDQKLHRVPGLQLMVDCLFTTPEYTATNVQVLDGVSDHCAIVAEVTHNLPIEN